MLWRFRPLDLTKPFENSKSTFLLIICNVNVPFVRSEVELQLDIIKIILAVFRKKIESDVNPLIIQVYIYSTN